MASWEDLPRPGLVDWLLECGNPSVRYFTLTDILDLPAGDPEVIETRTAISGAVSGVGTGGARAQYLGNYHMPWEHQDAYCQQHPYKRFRRE